MESEVLAERILLDLGNIFKKDPMIDEFDILPVNDSIYNKCPVIHAEHKVALESWCVQHVYLYAYHKFINWRQHPHKIDTSTLLSWTRAVLLINPDLETAWNTRKELIQSGRYGEREDLKFSEVVLSRKPKSSQVFAHRKWILLRIWNVHLAPCARNELLHHELYLCSLTADRYSNNYYSWNHRMWIMQNLVNFCAKVVEDEYRLTKHWVSIHVSDHSGFHYRQFLMTGRHNLPPPSVLNASAKTCPLHSDSALRDSEPGCFVDSSSPVDSYVLLGQELSLLSSLQTSYPGHETLWNHRRFLVQKLACMPESAKPLPAISTCPSEPDEGVGCKKYKIESPISITDEWKVSYERQFMQQCLQNARDNCWERKLVARHETWMKNVGIFTYC